MATFFNARRLLFQALIFAALVFLFPFLPASGMGLILTLLVALFLGNWAYRQYKRYFFRTAIVFDFHGTMAKGHINLENYTDMPGMRGLVGRLRENYKVGLLTNMNPELYQFYSQKFGVESLFDFVYYSGKFKVQKPDAEIYRIVMRDLGVSPQNMVFIDDNPSYVAGAKAVGIRTVQFQNTEQVISELRKMGVKI